MKMWPQSGLSGKSRLKFQSDFLSGQKSGFRADKRGWAPSMAGCPLPNTSGRGERGRLAFGGGGLSALKDIPRRGPSGPVFGTEIAAKRYHWPGIMAKVGVLMMNHYYSFLVGRLPRLPCEP